MKFSKILLTTLLLNSFLIFPGMAQNIKPAVKEINQKVKPYLTLNQAIQIGVKNSHRVKLAQIKVDDAEWQITENAAQGLPQVNWQASYGRQDPVGPTINSGGGGGFGDNPQFAALLGLSSVNSFNSTISLSQVIFAGFRIIDGIRLAEINLSSMEESLRQAKQEAAFQVVNSYFTALKMWQIVEVDKLALIQSKRLLRSATKQLEAGTGVKLDVLRAKNQLLTIQQQLSKDMMNLTKARAGLNMSMGREVDTIVLLNPVAHLQEFDLLDTLKKTPKVAVKLAINNRSDIRQSQTNKEFWDLTSTIQSRAAWPQLSAQLSYRIQDNAVVNGNVANNQNMNYSLNLNWPIFDGLAASSKAQRAKKSAVQAQISLDQLQQQVALDLNQAVLDINEARERKLLAQQGVEVAEESVRIASISYQEGVGVNLNVIDAHVRLLQARQALIMADYDINTNLAKLYKALGFDIIEKLK